MSNRTALYESHIAAGARMVDFAGWEMPLHYGSQIEEHHSVRNEAGMFYVSHMTVIDVAGEQAGQFLCRLVANNVGKLVETGKALYGLLLNDAGGVVDDLIVYRREKGYRCVVNAGTREKVLVWFAEHNDEGVELEERDLAMVAVQGPRALSIYEQVSGLTGLAELAPFSARDMQETMVARTGYTG
ncbi:MAG: glycine cleavage system protein T, partial [Pseudomonadales bacterium]